jgi:hypothetical protein
MKPEILISTPFEIFCAIVLLIGVGWGMAALMFMIAVANPEDKEDKRNLKIK